MPKLESEDQDLQLVDRVLAGESQAFETLVRRQERRVFRTTLAVTGNPEDAEEAMQDTFLKTYQHLAEFRRDSRFSTWLTRIAVNEGLQRLRRRKPTESLDDPGTRDDQPQPRQLEDWGADPEQRYAVQELREMVEAAIRALPPAYRVVFVLRDVEGLTTDEAVAVLGLSIAAVKSRLLRARLMVREALAGRLAKRPTLKSRLLDARALIGKILAMPVRRAPGQKAEKR